VSPHAHHSMLFLNKSKNVNGVILEAYTEELNLFQICEMLVPDNSDRLAFIIYARCQCLVEFVFSM
jgi:hypothetical protein